MSILRYITHPEVSIDPDQPIERWHLSELGRQRAHALLGQPWVADLTTVISSDETKATETALLLGNHLNLSPDVRSGLGENDRSATGFLPPDEFERTVDEFFTHPDTSIRGWETADDAQRRIVTNLADVLHPADQQSGDIAVVGHGGVGTLLFCHLTGQNIDRRHDQPHQGHYFSVDLATTTVLHPWLPIDADHR